MLRESTITIEYNYLGLIQHKVYEAGIEPTLDTELNFVVVVTSSSLPSLSSSSFVINHHNHHRHLQQSQFHPCCCSFSSSSSLYYDHPTSWSKFPRRPPKNPALTCERTRPKQRLLILLIRNLNVRKVPTASYCLPKVKVQLKVPQLKVQIIHLTGVRSISQQPQGPSHNLCHCAKRCQSHVKTSLITTT